MQRSLALGALLLLSLILPSIAGDEVGPPPTPLQGPAIDLDPWSVGHEWTYRSDTQTRFPDGTRITAVATVTTQVAEVLEVAVNGAAYTVYNGTTTGTFTSDGTIFVPSIGLVQFSLTGSVAGWLWTDRSDQAIVRTNQTTVGSGWAQVGIFTFPLNVDSASTTTFVPPEEDLDFPLEPGDAWSFNVTTDTRGYAHANIQGVIDQWQNLSGYGAARSQLWFNDTQNVAVPAGSFADAAHVHGAGSQNSWSDRWYHPSAHHVVKFEVHTVNGADDYVRAWTNLTAFSLAASSWPGSVVLAPSRVSPGGWVTASGSALPNEDLTVRVPAVNQSYAVRANASGLWSVQFPAPNVDDHTPANADVGSHGVLVEPAVAPSGWDVSTLQLVLPDLFVEEADLRVSPLTPVMGEFLFVNATVHAGPDVAVNETFSVTFALDGVPFANRSVAVLPAGGFAELNETVNAPNVPGWHSITLVADSGGAIQESDEDNNSASRSFLVLGPDLAPMDVTIASDGNASYPDPADVGFVSAPMPARLGGFVNISFYVENVGSSSVNSVSRVAIIETETLFGPPIGPRILEATASPPLNASARAGPWTASWPVPARPGTYFLNLTVDADAEVSESWEANNTFGIVVSVSGPDYRILNVTAPAKVTALSTHSLHVPVGNEGQLDADRPVFLAVYEGGSPTPFATASVPPISSGNQTSVIIPWAAPTSGAIVNIRFVIDDAAGLDETDETNNEASASIDVRDPPITSVSWSGPNVTTTELFVTTATAFAFAAVDRSDTEAVVWYRVDAGPEVRFADSFVLASEGSHSIAYWSVDGLGGRDLAKQLLAVVDDSPPSTTSELGSQVRDRMTMVLNATDGNGSGVALIEYRVDGENWTTYVEPFEISGYGDHTVTFRAVDRLGLREPDRSVLLTISRPVSGSTNWKPLLAVVFAFILVGVGYVRGVGGRGWRVTSPRMLAILFALAELATGGLSVFITAMAVPPSGLALAIDLAILGFGLLAVWRAPRPAPLASDADPGREVTP